MHNNVIQEALRLLSEDSSEVVSSENGIKLDKHTDYPDVIDNRMYSLNNGNSYGISCECITFTEATVNDLPYPFKGLRTATATIKERAWFLNEADAKKYAEQRGGKCEIVSKSQRVFRAVRIDVNGDIPIYANILYLKAFDPEVLHPIILKRLKEGSGMSIQHSTENPETITKNDTVNSSLNTFEQLLKAEFDDVQIDRSDIYFNAFVPIASILKSPVGSVENYSIFDEFAEALRGIEFVKDSMENNSIGIMLRVNKSKKAVPLPINMSAFKELANRLANVYDKNNKVDLTNFHYDELFTSTLNTQLKDVSVFNAASSKSTFIIRLPIFTTAAGAVQPSARLNIKKELVEYDVLFVRPPTSALPFTIPETPSHLKGMLKELPLPFLPKNFVSLENILTNIEMAAQKVKNISSGSSHIKVSELSER